MATITTDTYLDGGTARTAGESWTINGATLTVRTDTRWHANAPAAMTGSLGNITCTTATGGGYFIDGTKVRWLPYNSGSGNVPAIGTTITQGGVSGYLLGVWADYTSAPTAVGAAMPATGYIKFREVTGGTYSAGALTGIGASATGADVLGWIEVVHDTSTTTTISTPGLGFKTRGGWFDLGTTSGSAHQIVQVPTNGGGTNTECFGLYIETAPGSNAYEWWPAVTNTAAAGYGFTATTCGTDDRSKVVRYVSNGQMQIGGDGTTLIGKLPAAGCKIKVPNIFLRLAAAATRATNAAQSTTATSNSRFSSVNGGSIDIEYVYSAWSHNYATATKCVLKNSAISFFISFSQMLGNILVENVAVSHINSTTSNNTILNCNLGGTFNDVTFSFQAAMAAVYTSSPISANFTFNNLKVIKCSSRAAAQVNVVTNGTNCTFNNLKTIAGFITLSGGSSVFNNTDYCDRILGDVTATGAQNIFTATAGAHEVNGLSFGLNGTYNNQFCYGTLFDTSNASLTVKNIGSFDAPLNTGSGSLKPQRLHISASTDRSVKFQRVYTTGIRSGSNFINLTSATSNTFTYDNMGDTTYTAITLDLTVPNTLVRGMLCSWSGFAASSNAAGNHFADIFTSTTAGSLIFLGNAPSTLTTQYVTLYGTAQFIGNGSVQLPANGDYAIIESPYSILGHTALANTAPTLTGSGNYSTEYQIYNGSSWNGTWKTLSAANLSAETISATGFKIKIKVTATDNNASRYFTRARIVTVSTSAAQRDNLYPLSTATLGFTGLQPGSEVRVYAGTDPATSVEIGGIESTSGSTFSFSHSYGGTDGYIMIFALGYQPIYIPYTFKSVDDSILIQQVIDRNYTNPA